MNIVYMIRHASRVHANRIAVDYEGQQITWKQFYRVAQNSARRLVELGVRKGDRVGVLFGNSPAFLDLYYSIAMAGALIVPLNTRWAAQEMRFTLEDSGSKLLFIDDRFAHLKDQLGGIPVMEPFAPDADGPGFDYEEPDENDVAGLFYTSGTTGGPKGAMLTHRNIYMNALHICISPFGPEPHWRWLHASPMFHLADAGVLHGVTLNGATHCFLPSFDAEALMKAIERYRVTHVLLVPTMINLLLNHPNFGRYDLSSLQGINYGASPMPLALLKEAMDKLGCKFTQGYGMTEASPLLTALHSDDHRLDNADQRFAPVKSAGKPAVGVEVRVVDFDDRELPPGEVGEIVARGPNVMKGYWNRPDINAEVLRGGWLHTGDLGAFDEEGYLYIYDRKKDMIKTGSENVYSPEVESALCAHADVLEAAVIGIPDPVWGETIRAVVVLRPGCQASPDDLIAWCRGRLTHFKCPRSVVFTDSLPKGGTGKVQKQVLRARFGSAATAGS